MLAWLIACGHKALKLAVENRLIQTKHRAYVLFCYLQFDELLYRLLYCPGFCALHPAGQRSYLVDCLFQLLIVHTLNMLHNNGYIRIVYEVLVYDIVEGILKRTDWVSTRSTGGKKTRYLAGVLSQQFLQDVFSLVQFHLAQISEFAVSCKIRLQVF